MKAEKEAVLFTAETQRTRRKSRVVDGKHIGY
jgi:hypothetical protein